jgi:hypothetical protein
LEIPANAVGYSTGQTGNRLQENLARAMFNNASRKQFEIPVSIQFNSAKYHTGWF